MCPFAGLDLFSRGWRSGIFVYCVAIAALAGTIIVSSPVRAETLLDALAAAYENNSRLSAERARQRATDEEVPQALSGWRPTASVQARAGIARQDAGRAPGATDTLQPRSIALEIEQPIYRGGRTVSETRQAESSVLRGRAELLNTEQDVFLDAVTAYMDALRDSSIVDLQDSNVAFLTEELEATHERFDVGEVTRTDLAQAEARLSGAKAGFRRAEADLAGARARYEEVMGRAAGTLVLPESPDGLPQTPAEAIAAIERNPNVVGAEFELQQSRHATDVARSDFRPNLSFVGRAEHAQDGGFRGSENETLSAQLRLSVPLYQAGLVSSRTRESRQLAIQRQYDVVTARRNAKQAAISAWEELAATRASIESTQAQIAASEIALEGVRIEERVGSRTLLDILDARQELLNARVELTRSQRDEIVAAYSLMAATGELSVKSLDIVVEQYDPTAYYDSVRGAF